MSQHFKITALIKTMGPAMSVDHDGAPYENTDYPAGTIFAFDVEGDLYVYAHHDGSGVAFEEQSDERCWPEPSADGTIRLFRDFWRFVMTLEDWKKKERDLAPYFRAIRNAPFHNIWAKV